jgi:hypothetical protein
MFNINLTEEQRVQKSAVAIMAHRKWADTGGVLMLGERRVCDTTPTAYTNGKDVVFGVKQFVSKLSVMQSYGSLTYTSNSTSFADT